MLLAEDFEEGEIADLSKKWTEVSNKDDKVLAWADDGPEGTQGKRCIQMTATLGQDVGGHLYAPLPRGVDTAYARFYVKWSGMGFQLLEEGGEELEGFRWRTSTDLQVTYFWLEHCVTENAAKQNGVKDPRKVNRVWFDDVVVATEYVGPIARWSDYFPRGDSSSFSSALFGRGCATRPFNRSGGGCAGTPGSCSGGGCTGCGGFCAGGVPAGRGGGSFPHPASTCPARTAPASAPSFARKRRRSSWNESMSG